MISFMLRSLAGTSDILGRIDIGHVRRGQTSYLLPLEAVITTSSSSFGRFLQVRIQYVILSQLEIDALVNH